MNLMYAFLNNNFSKIDSNKKDFSYAAMPAYYKQTYNHNKQFFDNAYMVCQQEEIDRAQGFGSYITVESLQTEPVYMLIQSILE